MLKTKKPSAIVYGWRELGTFTLTSDVYFEEDLMDEVVIYSLPFTDNIENDFSLYKPDIIMGCDDRVSSNSKIISNRIIRYINFPPDNILANDVTGQTKMLVIVISLVKMSAFHLGQNFIQFVNVDGGATLL